MGSKSPQKDRAHTTNKSQSEKKKKDIKKERYVRYENKNKTPNTLNTRKRVKELKLVSRRGNSKKSQHGMRNERRSRHI